MQIQSNQMVNLTCPDFRQSGEGQDSRRVRACQRLLPTKLSTDSVDDFVWLAGGVRQGSEALFLQE